MTPDTQISSEIQSSQAEPHSEQEALEGASTLPPTLPASRIIRQEKEDAAAVASVRSSLAALAAKLPLQLDLRVPLPSFRVQDLLSLEKGQVVETVWPHTEDLPLWSGGVQLMWSEFEVLDQKLAVRVTRLV